MERRQFTRDKLEAPSGMFVEEVQITSACQISQTTPCPLYPASSFSAIRCMEASTKYVTTMAQIRSQWSLTLATCTTRRSHVCHATLTGAVPRSWFLAEPPAPTHPGQRSTMATSWQQQEDIFEEHTNVWMLRQRAFLDLTLTKMVLYSTSLRLNVEAYGVLHIRMGRSSPALSALSSMNNRFWQQKVLYLVCCK